LNYRIVEIGYENCGICGETMPDNWAFRDQELQLNICPDCRVRCIIASGQLAAHGIKECVQVSGGKPLENGGN